MIFIKHPDSTMGMFVESVAIRDEMVELEFAFNRAENPELDAEYTAWLEESAPTDEA